MENDEIFALKEILSVQLASVCEDDLTKALGMAADSCKQIDTEQDQTDGRYYHVLPYIPQLMEGQESRDGDASDTIGKLRRL